MAYVIAEPCIGTKDTACVDACPVDCIHPKKDEPNHPTEELLYIDPIECIDCGACEPACCAEAAAETAASAMMESEIASRMIVLLDGSLAAARGPQIVASASRTTCCVRISGSSKGSLPGR